MNWLLPEATKKEKKKGKGKEKISDVAVSGRYAIRIEEIGAEKPGSNKKGNR